MKKIQKKLRDSFNVFSNSARWLGVPLTVSNAFLRSIYNEIVFSLLFLFNCKSVVYLKIVSIVECFFLKPFC